MNKKSTVAAFALAMASLVAAPVARSADAPTTPATQGTDQKPVGDASKQPAQNPCAPDKKKASNPCGPSKKKATNPCGPSNPCGPKKRKSAD